MRNTASIREIVVSAIQEALNAAVNQHEIAPGKVVSVILQPRHALAIGDYEAKYRT